MINWRSKSRLWREAYITLTAGGFIAVFSMLGMLACLIWAASGMNTDADTLLKEGITLLKLAATAAVFALVSSLLVMMIPGMSYSDVGKSGRWLIRNCNPVGVIYWLFWRIPRMSKNNKK